MLVLNLSVCIVVCVIIGERLCVVQFKKDQQPKASYITVSHTNCMPIQVILYVWACVLQRIDLNYVRTLKVEYYYL